MNILVTGGAGYVGSVLVPGLLSLNHEVTVFDNLSFGGNQLLPLFKFPNFKFIKGDIVDSSSIRQSMIGKDVIIHLAAIVGYPACRKHPELAKAVNVDGTKNIISGISKDQLVIYASTGSNYGSVDDICTEETELKPLSLYGQTKTLAETLLLDKVDKVIVYRFATAFGVSPRMRLDLMINDFTYRCKTQGYLVVYESTFMRTFIHVRDMALAIMMAIDKRDIMNKNVYNVGGDSMNFTKKQICDIIAKETGAYVHYASVGEDADKRNYSVSYNKIKSLGYSTTISVERGINELLRSFDVIETSSAYCNA